MHYAIHKLHWAPSTLLKWLDCGHEMQAFYYGSLELKVEHDKAEADRIKRDAKHRKQK